MGLCRAAARAVPGRGQTWRPTDPGAPQTPARSCEARFAMNSS